MRGRTAWYKFDVLHKYTHMKNRGTTLNCWHALPKYSFIRGLFVCLYLHCMSGMSMYSVFRTCLYPYHQFESRFCTTASAGMTLGLNRHEMKWKFHLKQIFRHFFIPIPIKYAAAAFLRTFKFSFLIPYTGEWFSTPYRPLCRRTNSANGDQRNWWGRENWSSVEIQINRWQPEVSAKNRTHRWFGDVL